MRLSVRGWMGIVAALALIQVLMPATGLIGIRYLVVVPNQPLRHPVRVATVEGGRLKLADGRVFELSESIPPVLLPDSIAESNGLVDVEAGDQGQITVWVSHRRTICGVGMAQPIQIPLIPLRRERNARSPLGIARLVPAGPSGGTDVRP